MISSNKNKNFHQIFFQNIFHVKRKLADRLGSKSLVHQQQRNQYETQLFNIYSTRHEQLLETTYLNILEKQYTNDNRLGLKQQLILDSLNQHFDFSKLIENFLDYRLSLIDQTNEQMNKIINYIKIITDNSKLNINLNENKKQKQDLNIDLNIINLIEKTKQIQMDFSKKYFHLLKFSLYNLIYSSNSIVNSFVNYIHQQNEDFRPKSNDLSNQLDNLFQTKTNEWKNILTN